MKTLKRSFFILSCLLSTNMLQAHQPCPNNQVPQASLYCPCGCGCKAPCNCGCTQGKACTCHSHNQK